jgi:RHS repeat-associated protein
MTYTYDADGNRVKKTNGSTGTLYWYGAPGIIAESDLAGNLKSEYVFFNGKRTARIDLPSGTVHYYLSDHLNSTSMVVSAAAVVEEESDYSPFGTEYVLTGSGSNHYKFTGKERDSESGLDYFGARYNSSSMGRFMTPDPLGGLLIDPQTLNRYTYVRNNPLRYTDPTGMYICADSAKCDSKQDKAFEQSRQNDLKSKDDNVVRAAKAYGDPTKDNGTTVKFGDPGKGNDGITKHDLGQDPKDTNKLRAVETVTIKSGLSGSALDAAVGHEGSHVADAQDFAASINAQGGFDASKNLSTYKSELRAYLVTQSILSSENEKRGFGTCGMANVCILGAGVGPAQARETINRLLANPQNGYGGVTPQNPGPTLYPSLTAPK